MAATIAAHISLSGLPRAKSVALEKKARRLGISLQEYVQQLIKDDLELDEIAASKTLTELSRPFRKALAGVSEPELDELARPTVRRKRKK